MDPFVVVAVGASEADAAERFDAWLRRRGLERESLAPGDVRTDTIERLMGIRFWRYWVRGSLVTGQAGG